MPQVAKIFTKVVGGVNDNTLILNTRCQLVYPFNAPEWKDLRVGFFLSLTQLSADDTITGLAETLPAGDSNHLQEYTLIGVKSSNDAQVGQNVGFIGYSTYDGNPEAQSDLISSDGAIGTGTNFWRPRIYTTRPEGNTPGAIIMDSGRLVGAPFLNVDQHFAQVADGTSTHPYATLLMLRLTRTPQSPRNITVQISQGTHSADVLFTNTPTTDLLETNLLSYPTTVQTKTINNMANIPDAIYAYWPFHNSRLRIHASGFMKFA